MKKSKILLGLAGAAGLTVAVAPIISGCSCNKKTIDSIDSVVFNGTASTVGDKIYAADFTVTVKYSDGSKGTVAVGNNCNVTIDGNDITSQLTSTNGYEIAKDTNTFTIKIGNKTKELTKTFQPKAVLESITATCTVAEGKNTTGGFVKAENFTVTANYKQGETTTPKTLTWGDSGYSVVKGGQTIADFKNTGCALANGNNTFTFSYADKSIECTVTARDITASVDSTYVEKETEFAQSTGIVKIKPTDSSVTNITDITKITKGGTQLTKGTDYTVSDDNKTITLQASGFKVLGNLVITPSIKNVTSLDVTRSSTCPSKFTTGGVVTSSDFVVKGKYSDGTFTDPLVFGTGYKAYDPDGNEITNFSTTGYTFGSTGDHTLTFKMVTGSGAASTEITGSNTMTVADTTASLESETAATISAFTQSTRTVTVSPKNGYKISDIATVTKGGNTLSTDQYDKVKNDDESWTITLKQDTMKINGDLVVTPTTSDSKFYITDDGLVSLTDTGKAETKAIEVPEKVRGITVTGVASFAGSSCTGAITFANAKNITTISANAFNKTDITSIDLSYVTSIGSYAFSDCTHLSSVNLSYSTITTVPSKAFYNCNALTSITLPSTVTKIDSEAFRNSGLTTIIIPAKVKTIGDYAFGNSGSLATVTLASGSELKTIKFGAFWHCSSLETISTLPSTIESIRECAFYDCSKLTSVAFTTTTANTWIQVSGTSYIDITDATTNATNLKNCSSSTENNWGFTGIKKASLKTMVITETAFSYGSAYHLDANETGYNTIMIETSEGEFLDGVTFACSEENIIDITGQGKGYYNLSLHEGFIPSQHSITVTASKAEFAIATFEVEVATFAGVTFNSTGESIYSYVPGTGVTDFYVPSRHYNSTQNKWISVTNIEANACAALSITNVDIPTSVTKIEGLAFQDTTSLLQVRFTDESIAKTWIQSNTTTTIDIETATTNATNLKNCELGAQNNWGYTGIEVQTKTTFAQTDWSVISTAATAFENSDQGVDAMKALCASFTDTEYVETGSTVEEHLANFIGKEKTVTVNDQAHTVRVIGVNHDTLETAISSNTKATFTFELVTLLSGSNGNAMQTRWEETGSNRDYTNSTLRANLNGTGTASKKTWDKTALDMLPSELKSSIKTVTKQVATTSSYTLNTYNDKLFPLTYTEMAQSGSYAKVEGSAYKYWSDHNNNNDRIKRDANGSTLDYWLCSPYSYGGVQAWYVDSKGNVYSKNANINLRVSFGFCI